MRRDENMPLHKTLKSHWKPLTLLLVLAALGLLVLSRTLAHAQSILC